MDVPIILTTRGSNILPIISAMARLNICALCFNKSPLMAFNCLSMRSNMIKSIKTHKQSSTV